MPIIPNSLPSAPGQAAAGGGGYGLNPLTDIMRGTSSLGSFINQHTNIGGFNPGIGSVIQTVANIVPGLANLGYQGTKDLVTGNFGAAGALGANLVHGVANSFVDTGLDAATIGGLAPWTNPAEHGIESLTHGYIQPTSLRQYATQPGQGLLGGALNDALNLSLVGDGAAAIAQVGDIGAAARASIEAETAEKVLAVDKGMPVSQLQEIGENARAASIQDSADKLAETQPGADPAALAERIAQRARLLDTVKGYSHGVQSLINPLIPIRQLGRAASLAAAPAEELAPEAAEAAPVSGATSTPNAAQGLPGASEGTLQEALREAVAAHPEVPTTPINALPQEAPGTTRLYNAGGGAQAIWTDSLPRAESYVNTPGPGQGVIRSIDMPIESIGARAVDYLRDGNGEIMRDENGEAMPNAAYREALRTGEQVAPGKDYYFGDPPGQELTRPHGEYGPVAAPPEEPRAPETPEETEFRKQMLEHVPAAYKSYLERATPVPEWAKGIVSKLPPPMVKLLRWSDELRQLREATVITRQTKVALNVVAREVENDPAIQELVSRAQQLMADRIPGMTPEVASKVIGERVQLALVLGPMWRQLEALRPELEEVAPGLTDHILSLHANLPPEFDTPEFQDEIEQIAAPIRALRASHLEQLKNSAFFGEKGLANANLEGALMTKGEQALYEKIQANLEEATKTEAAGRERVAGEIKGHLENARKAREAALVPSEEGTRLREAARRIEDEGADAANEHAINLREQRDAEVAEAANPHPQSTVLRARDAQLEGQARAELSDEANGARVEQSRQAERAAAPSPEAEAARAQAAEVRGTGGAPMPKLTEPQQRLINEVPKDGSIITEQHAFSTVGGNLSRAMPTIRRLVDKGILESVINPVNFGTEGWRLTEEYRATGGNPSLAAHLEDQADYLDDLKNQDADLKGKLAGRQAEVAEGKLAQERVTTPELAQRADQLDAQHQAEHLANATRLQSQIAEHDANIENGTLPSDYQAAQVRENATRADEAMQNQKAVVMSSAQASVRQLQAALEAHMLPEDIAAQKLRMTAYEQEEKLGESLSNAGRGRVAPKWQPFLLAGKRMADAVDQYPELAPILETLPKTFGEVLDYADEHGFDPTHMPDMTVDQVKRLVNGTVRLGGQQGKLFESGARKARTGALAAQDLADRSVEAIIAGVVHATQEERTNMVVDWLDRTIARPIPLNLRGGKEIPPGFTAYDPVRQGLLAAINPEGERAGENMTSIALKGGAERMIPVTVARGLAEYSSDVSNPLARAMQTITDPWRFFMLTLNPSFYLHHIIGHVMLNLFQGNVGLGAWLDAYRAARSHFEDIPEVTGQNIVEGELGKPGVVQYPDFRTALAQGGKRAAAGYLTQFSRKIIEFTDSFSRAVDFFTQRREGASEMEAMQHANTFLVDYGNLSPFEKNVARSLIPFYGFNKGILKIALHMPIDHPLITSVLMQVGKYQNEASVDANGNPLPTGYQGVVNILGHNVNLKNLSPFKDLGALTTPAGIVNNLQYAIQAAVRSGLNAPAPFTKAGTQVGPYGNLVPKVSFLSQLGPALTSSPQGQLVAGLTGNSTKTPGQAALGFAGLPLVNQQTLNAAGERNVLSSAEVAASTPAQQAAETAFPVDTQTAQALLQQQLAANPSTPLIPTDAGSTSPTITQAQIQQALTQAKLKQAAASAATKARGYTKSGVKTKGGGGSSHRRSSHRARGRRVSRGKTFHATKSKLRGGIVRQHVETVKAGRGGAGGALKLKGLKMRSSIRGVPGVSNKG